MNSTPLKPRQPEKIPKFSVTFSSKRSLPGVEPPLMLKTIIASFILALHNIRSNFFHTVLSVLGVVIGVAALVAILSLIDGMEQYARDQITNTTSLKMIHITIDPYTKHDDIAIRKDSVTLLHYDDFRALEKSLSKPAKAFIYTRAAKELTIEGNTSRMGVHATAVVRLDTIGNMVAGRGFSAEEIDDGYEVCILTENLARKLAGSGGVKDMLGRKVNFTNHNPTVIGIINLKHAQGPELFYPLTTLTPAELKAGLPQCIVDAENVEDVPRLKDDITKFLSARYHGKHDFKVATNELRVEQAAKGFQLFRIIMGLIVGISVVVGGIGVMNVLLISVTERTSEIGVRKAVGANRRHIVLQFLSESITISLFGSFMGMIIGILATMVIVPIIKSLTKMPFQAVYTFNTLMVVSVLAVVVGVVFGTYPALRASRLDPVEAIRRE